MSARIKAKLLDTEHRAITSKDLPLLPEVYGLQRLPYAPSRIGAELEGVPIEIANGLRRGILDETPAYALRVPEEGSGLGFTGASTERFMLPPCLRSVIQNIPLNQLHLNEMSEKDVADLRFRIDVSNPRGTRLRVLSADLTQAKGKKRPYPLFNPTLLIAEVQPGARLVIEDISVVRATGSAAAQHQWARNASCVPLDVERYSAEEIAESSTIAELSDFKQSCLLANPRKFRITASLPAALGYKSEAALVFTRACSEIQRRLRAVYAGVTGDSSSGVRLTAVPVDNGRTRGTLHIPHETATVRAIITRFMGDLDAGAVVLGSEDVKQNAVVIEFNTSHDAAELVSEALLKACSLVEEIGIMLAA